MTEKELLKKSGFYTSFILFFVSLFWFLFSIQTSFGGYTGGPASGIDVGINSRSTAQTNWQVGSSGVYVIRLGIENVTGLGTATGYMTGTNTYYPRIEWTPTLGTFNFVGTGSYPVTLQMNGVAIPSLGSVSGKIDAVGGTGTNNTFNNPTLAGVGTITASFGANGLVVSPAELSMVDGATIPLNTATGSITNHAHTGSDGTTKIAHDNATGTGTNSHPIIDTFIASKASASGLASLDANSLVVQNPASGTSTPGISKIPISLGTGFLNDSWLSSVISKLGQTIELGTETIGTTDNVSEGNTNKYYTDSRVNATIGSSSITSPQISPKITLISPAVGQFLKIVNTLGDAENGTSSVSAGFGEITGTPTDNAFFSEIPGANKVPYSTNGTLAKWNTYSAINFTGTTTEQGAGSLAIVVGTSTVVPSDIALLLHMDNPGTSTFIDSSNNIYSVSAVGNAIGTSTTPKFGHGAGLFDGTGDYLTVGTGATLKFLHGAEGTSTFSWTIEGWFKADNFAANAGLFDEINNSGLNIGLMVRLLTNRIINVAIYNGVDAVIDFNTVGTFTNDTTNYHHVEIGYNQSLGSNNCVVFVDGSQIGTGTKGLGVPSTSNATNPLTIGAYAGGANAFSGKMDEIVIWKNTVRHTTDFTTPTSGDFATVKATNYTLKYRDPVNNNVLLSIKTHGTATHLKTVIGHLGSITMHGSDTPYSTDVVYLDQGVQGGGKELFDGYDSYCLGEYKEIINSGDAVAKKYYDLLRVPVISEHHPKLREVDDAIIEDVARTEYIYKDYNNEFELFKITNIDSYTTIENGSETVNYNKMFFDFDSQYRNQKALKWASELTQTEIIRQKEIELESNTSITNVSLVSDHELTPVELKGDDKRTMSLDRQVGALIGGFQEAARKIESLEAKVQAQQIEIDYLKTLHGPTLITIPTPK